jgi:hypothetical protein
MVRRLLGIAAIVVGITAFGFLYMLHSIPPIVQPPQKEQQNTNTVRQCCLSDIQTAEEALVKLSSEAQKLLIRATATAKKKNSEDPKSVSLELIAKQARLLWDELEDLRNNDRENARRIVRDITISLEQLKEAFCHVPSDTSDAFKMDVQTVDYRFRIMMMKLKITPLIEGEVKLSQVKHNNGNSYTVHQDFGTPGDSMESPEASNLRLYENGREIGPGHAPHADIEQLGYGRWSHWKGNLYFSTSDNSNPLTNGRRYSYRIYPNVPASVDGIRPCENEPEVSRVR